MLMALREAADEVELPSGVVVHDDARMRAGKELYFLGRST